MPTAKPRRGGDPKHRTGDQQRNVDHSKEDRPLEDVRRAGGVASLQTHEDVEVKDGDDRDDKPPPRAATTGSAIVMTV
jgi:hypothetical protein